MIQYLKRNEINIERWDQLIEKASNPLVYACSWYLDIVCNAQWDALVYGDYQWVMPLPWRKRMGLAYIYQPFCTPQLGVFGLKNPNEDCIKAFEDAIPSRFKLIDQKLNERHSEVLKDQASEHTSYLLDLSVTADELKAAYNQHTRRSIRKAQKNFLKFSDNLEPKGVLHLFKKNKGLELKDIQDKDYELLLQVLENGREQGVCKSLGVLNERGECIAACCILFFQRKAFFLLSAINDEGKDKRAMYFLLDHFFTANCSRELVFDFEGSDIPGLARFYKGFGAYPIRYYTWTSFNNGAGNILSLLVKDTSHSDFFTYNTRHWNFSLLV
jgi:hypothetical protein